MAEVNRILLLIFNFFGDLFGLGLKYLTIAHSNYMHGGLTAKLLWFLAGMILLSLFAYYARYLFDTALRFVLFGIVALLLVSLVISLVDSSGHLALR